MHEPQKDRRCCQKRCTAMISGLVFLLMAILQTTRIATNWPVFINDFFIPVWVNIVLAIITFVLAICNFRCSYKCPCCKKNSDGKCEMDKM